MPTPTYDASKKLPTPTMATLATGLDAFVIPDIVDTPSGQFWFFDEYDDNRVYDGSTLKVVSGVAPAALPVVSAVAPVGAGETGPFYYTYSLVDPDSNPNVETGAAAGDGIPPWASVTLASQDATFDIPNPAAGSRFTRARIWRSVKFTADMRQVTGVAGSDADVVLTPGAGGNVTYVDSFTVSDETLKRRDRLPLTKRAYPEGLPPRARTGMFFNNRLYINDEDNRVIYSELSPNVQDFPTAGTDGAPRNIIELRTGPQDKAPKIVALRVNNGERYAYTRQGIYNIFGDTPPFGVRCVVMGVGAQSAATTIYVEGLGVVFMGLDKPYVHLGGDRVVPLGLVRELPNQNPVEDLYQEYDAGRLKDAVGDVDPETGVYRATFGTNGIPVNNRTLLDEYVIPGGGAWTMDQGRPVTRWGRWVDESGRERIVFGNDLGQVWQADLGNSEGVFDGTFSDTIVSASRRTVVGTAGVTAWAVGAPVCIKSASTREVLYRNRLLTYDAGSKTFTMLYPWTTLPVAGQIVEVGSIEGVIETGWFSLFADRLLGKIVCLTAYFSKQAANSLIRVLYGTDQIDTMREVSYDAPMTTPNQVLPMSSGNAAQAKVRLEESTPGTDFGVQGFDLDMIRKVYGR